MNMIVYTLLLCWPPYRASQHAAALYFEGFTWAAQQLRQGYSVHGIAAQIDCDMWADAFDYGALAALNTIRTRGRHPC